MADAVERILFALHFVFLGVCVFKEAGVSYYALDKVFKIPLIFIET